MLEPEVFGFHAFAGMRLERVGLLVRRGRRQRMVPVVCKVDDSESAVGWARVRAERRPIRARGVLVIAEDGRLGRKRTNGQIRQVEG